MVGCSGDFSYYMSELGNGLARFFCGEGGEHSYSPSYYATAVDWTLPQYSGQAGYVKKMEKKAASHNKLGAVLLVVTPIISALLIVYSAKSFIIPNDRIFSYVTAGALPIILWGMWRGEKEIILIKFHANMGMTLNNRWMCC